MHKSRLSLGILALAVSLSWADAGVRAEEDPVVAIVNGEKIAKSHLVEAQQLLPPQYQKIPLEQIFPLLVDSVIDTKLAAADARTRKLDKDPDFVSQMKRIEEQLLQRMVLQQEMEKGVTDAALKARYEKMTASMTDKEEVHARHILVKTEDEAKKIIEELDDGADFAELAKKKSTGPSGPNGGDLGFFGKGQMVPAFEKAAFGLDKGKFTGKAVQTQFGWHVIKVEEKRKAQVPGFASVEQQLRGELTQETGTAYVSGLRNTAKVERFDLDGKPLAQEKAPPKSQ